MTPQQRTIARLMLEEVHRNEIKLADLRHEVALLRTGLHPGIPVARALVAWGVALQSWPCMSADSGKETKP